MKLVSLFVFALALVGSWRLIHAERLVGESVHAGIQSDVKSIIAEFVKSKLPESQELHFKKFWTETLSKDKVRASFLYSFRDESSSDVGPGEIEVEGTAILNKIEETPEASTWSLDELMVSGSHITFDEPLQITTRAGALEGPEKTPSQESDHH